MGKPSLIFILFSLVCIIGIGPGAHLINSPKLLGGVPTLYLWALGVFTLQIACLLLANFLIWKKED